MRIPKDMVSIFEEFLKLQMCKKLPFHLPSERSRWQMKDEVIVITNDEYCEVFSSRKNSQRFKELVEIWQIYLEGLINERGNGEKTDVENKM